MERRRTFSRKFKLEAVRLVTERGVAVSQATKDLAVHETVSRKWDARAAAGAFRRRSLAMAGKRVRMPR
jgi:transposase-like protein